MLDDNRAIGGAWCLPHLARPAEMLARRHRNAVSLKEQQSCFITILNYAKGHWQSFAGLECRQILFTASFASLIHAFVDNFIFCPRRSRYPRLKLSCELSGGFYRN